MNAGQKLPGTPEPMHYWVVEKGLKLAGDSWGDPGGALVILQHGGGQTRHAWRGAGERLAAAGYWVVAFDARGHGDSDWDPEGDYRQDAMVQDLECIVEALGRHRPVLVGASMGGVAHIHSFMSQKPEGFDSLEEVAQAIANYQPHRGRRHSLDGLAKNVRLGADGRYHWHWDPRFRGGRSSLDLRQERMEACAARLNLPTLLVRGGLSDVLSEAGAQAFLALCPHSEYVRVADAAHMVAGDRNDRFGDAVIEFLARVVPPHGEPLQKARELHPASPGIGHDLQDVP